MGYNQEKTMVSTKMLGFTQEDMWFFGTVFLGEKGCVGMVHSLFAIDLRNHLSKATYLCLNKGVVNWSILFEHGIVMYCGIPLKHTPETQV